MTVGDFLAEAREDYERYGASSVRFTAEELFQGILSRAGYFANYGGDFYDHGWDLLILLDACRWDLMEEVVEEYDFIESHGSFVGQSSHSREFLHKTFMENRRSGLNKLQVWKEVLRDPDNIDIFKRHYRMQDNAKISETAYITWNMFSEMLDGDSFYHYATLGRQEWGHDDQILSPRKLTDYAIDLLRREDPERTIIHYMQPHTPFRDSDGTDVPGSVWDRIQRGEKNYHVAWEEYKENLRWVLDDVELLLENVDADKVVISSDHGNAIGEWGCYGHRPYVPVEAVKRVPWAETTAADQRTYEPEIEELSDADEDEIQERLEALGYK